MGSPVQEVFQGRGDKKGKGYWIKRSFPLLFIVAAWLGLLADFPVSRPALWFSISALTLLGCSLAHFLTKRQEFSLEFLFSLAVLLSGLISFSKLLWLKTAYFPLVIGVSAVYGPGTVIPLSLLVPFLGLKTFLLGDGFAGEAAFSVSLLMSAVFSSLLLSRLRKEKEKVLSSFNEIRDNARSIALATDMESLSSDELVSHYFASLIKTDEEIKDLLVTIKQAVFADSVNLFAHNGSSFTLRCSTEEKGDIIISDRGVISGCLRDKKVFYSGEVNEKRVEPGYIKNGRISSLIAAPVMDGPTPIGVLTVDSSRYQAFSETENKTVEMFTNHVVRILGRERVYLKIKRDVFGLRVLKDESSALVSSLNSEVIVKKLCEGAERIVPSQVFFFLARGRKFELVHNSAGLPENGKLFDLKGTFVNMGVENRQAIYMSDIADSRIPVMPFKSGEAGSVLVVPMVYENSILGLFVLLSVQKDFLDTLQIDLLKVMCNQASTSIANAQLHAEIEKMATTDGLTGLFNHRLFQEKLSGEFKRLNRFSKPLSLLLADIDYFKKINDAYGHPMGDLVLKGVAKLIRETIREIDVPARYGGEEFAVILPETDDEGARNIAERIRKALQEQSFSSDGRSFAVTMSIGISTSPTDAKNKEELIEKADQALYHAKHKGRNQSVHWRSIK